MFIKNNGMHKVPKNHTWQKGKIKEKNCIFNPKIQPFHEFY